MLTVDLNQINLNAKPHLKDLLGIIVHAIISIRLKFKLMLISLLLGFPAFLHITVILNPLFGALANSIKDEHIC